MNFLQNLLSDELIYAIGWTMIHSLWQGMLIAFLMAFALYFLQNKSAKLRYEVAGLSLFLVFIFAIGTFILLYEKIASDSFEAVLFTGMAEGFSGGSESFWQQYLQNLTLYFNDHLPMIVTIWLLGVAFFLLRLMGGLAYIQRLKYQYNEPLPLYWQNKLHSLMKRIPLRRKIYLVESALVNVPMVVGYLKPVILMPLGAVNNLSTQEVEAILAHELAHVWRNDYLLNIVLSFIEVLFYYHPAVWLISANIRNERENCADDIAVKLCGNSLTYAKALVSLQEMNPTVPAFAMSFSGKKNQLLHRIQRILDQPQTRSNIMEKFTATAMLLIAVLFLSVSSGRSVNQPHEEQWLDRSDLMNLFESQEEIPEADHRAMIVFSDTIPDQKKRRSHRIITRNDDNEDVEVEIKDGEIVGLRIDGETIPEEDYDNYEEYLAELIENMPPPPPLPPAPPAPPISPTAPVPPAPPAPPTLYRTHNQKVKVITTQKDENGQTIIMIDGGDENDFEILVDDNDVIFIDGNAMEIGDSLILVESGNAFDWAPRDFKIRSFGNFDSLVNMGRNFHFEFADPGELHFEHHGDWSEHTQEELEHLQEELQNIQEEYRSQLKEHREEMQSKMEERREEVRRLQKEMREREQEMRLEQRERQQEYRQLQAEQRERAREVQEEARAIAREQRVERQGQQKRLEEALITDGLIKDSKSYSFDLNKDRLKVNGKKRSKDLHHKYLDFYGRSSSDDEGENFNIRINKN